jgi:hypothetical protein
VRYQCPSIADDVNNSCVGCSQLCNWDGTCNQPYDDIECDEGFVFQQINAMAGGHNAPFTYCEGDGLCIRNTSKGLSDDDIFGNPSYDYANCFAVNDQGDCIYHSVYSKEGVGAAAVRWFLYGLPPALCFALSPSLSQTPLPSPTTTPPPSTAT